MFLSRRLFVKQNVSEVTRLNSWQSASKKLSVKTGFQHSETTKNVSNDCNPNSPNITLPALKKQANNVHSKLPRTELTPFNCLQVSKFFSKAQFVIPALNCLPQMVFQTAFHTQSKKSSHLTSLIEKFPKLLSPPKLFMLQSKSYATCIDDPISLKPDPVTGMTPKMVDLLKSLAAAVRPELHTHGVNIFKRVFQTDRNIQRIFPKFPCDEIDALEQNPMFNRHVDAIMKAILHNMEQSGSVSNLTTNMVLQRKIHKNLSIPDEHFITFGNVINDYLKETLGAQYSKDVECAVAYFWRYISLEMTLKRPDKCAQCGAIIVEEAKLRK